MKDLYHSYGQRGISIYPIENHKILSGWSGWKHCSKTNAEAIIALLPILKGIVRVRGRVTYGEIEEYMGHLLNFDQETRKADNCAMNHGRCLWTNNERIIETCKTDS
jgi:hypothetical protein